MVLLLVSFQAIGDIVFGIAAFQGADGSGGDQFCGKDDDNSQYQVILGRQNAIPSAVGCSLPHPSLPLLLPEIEDYGGDLVKLPTQTQIKTCETMTTIRTFEGHI